MAQTRWSPITLTRLHMYGPRLSQKSPPSTLQRAVGLPRAVFSHTFGKLTSIMFQ